MIGHERITKRDPNHRATLTRALALGALVCCTATVSASCGNSQASKGSATDRPIEQAKSASKSSADSSTAKGDTLRLKLFKCDDVGIGCTAFTMLVPADWKTEGGVVWQMQYSNLAAGKLRVWNPSGVEALEVFPVIPYVWDTRGIAFFQPGSIYMGNVVAAPPRDPEAFVREYVIQNFRRNVKNLIVGETTPLREVEHEISGSNQEAGLQKSTQAAKVRIAYIEGSKEIEEDVYCAYTVSRSREMLPTMSLWMPDRLFAFRAEKGKLDALEPLLQAMLASFRIDQRWFSGYLQVVQMARNNQMQAIKDAGDISKRISKNNDEIIAMNRKAWEAQQASSDRVMEHISDSIRGIERYENPFEQKPVELPSGYREVWASPSGEYVLSNDANFDPSAGTNVEWRRIEHKKE
jgi:hypothetical protein